MNNERLQYGSDQSGLICGYLFTGRHAGKALHTTDVLQYLNQTQRLEPSHFLWLHFNLANASTKNGCAKIANLPKSSMNLYTKVHVRRGLSTLTNT